MSAPEEPNRITGISPPPSPPSLLRELNKIKIKIKIRSLYPLDSPATSNSSEEVQKYLRRNRHNFDLLVIIIPTLRGFSCSEEEDYQQKHKKNPTLAQRIRYAASFYDELRGVISTVPKEEKQKNISYIY